MEKNQTYLFITGKLAAKALEKTLARLDQDFKYDITALNCTVAAFMNTEWIAGHLEPGLKYDWIIIPGLSRGGPFRNRKENRHPCPEGAKGP